MTRKKTTQPDPGIKGILEPFCETGTEGIVWSLQDEKHISADGKQWSYDGLNCLEDGDFLKVFNDAARKKVIWQGEIKLKHPPATRFNRGVQDGVDERKWTGMFFEAKLGTLYKKDVWAKMKAGKKARAEAREAARKKKIADIVQACHDGVDVKPMKRLTLKPQKPPAL
jgi:hypothetical protein